MTELVINHFYLGQMIEKHLGDGSDLGVKIIYSREPIQLETAGGIIKSLPKLQDESFIVVNADVCSDFDFSSLQPVDGVDRLAHLVLVRNAEHNPLGDFHIDDRGRVHEDPDAEGERLTFSGISVMHRNLFAGLPIQPMSVIPLLQRAMSENKVSGEIHSGVWVDVGTPERLQEVQKGYAASGEDAP